MRAVVPVAFVLSASLACAGVDAASPPSEPVVEVEAPADPVEAPMERRERARSRDGKKRPALPPPESQGVFVPPAEPCAERVAGAHDVEFDWNGTPTRAFLYVPAGTGPRPLVVLLHAGDADAAMILKQTRFDEKARAEGFAVLVPAAADVAGHGNHWNSGKFSSVVPESEQRDDVAYLEALTAQVRPQVCADRVLTAGFSSGGQMTHRWACQGEQVQAVLSAAGELLVDPATCKGPRAVRGYVGTRDKVFSSGPLAGAGQPSAPQTVELWAKINRCDATPPIESRVGDTTCKVWQGCAASTELCVIDGFPHGWPAPWNHGGLTQTDATDQGWRWFVGVSSGG